MLHMREHSLSHTQSLTSCYIWVSSHVTYEWAHSYVTWLIHWIFEENVSLTDARRPRHMSLTDAHSTNLIPYSFNVFYFKCIHSTRLVTSSFICNVRHDSFICILDFGASLSQVRYCNKIKRKRTFIPFFLNLIVYIIFFGLFAVPDLWEAHSKIANQRSFHIVEAICDGSVCVCVCVCVRVCVCVCVCV